MTRMSIDNLRKGPQKLAPFTGCVGVGGSGKTSTCGQLANSFFIGGEDGAPGLDILQLPQCHTDAEYFESIDTAEANIAELKPPHLVVDSFTDYIRKVEERLCAENGVSSLQEVPYGKGPALVEAPARALLKRLDMFRRRTGVPVIVIAHGKLESYADPEGEAYDRWTIDLNAKYILPLFVQSLDAVLYLQEQISRRKLKEGTRERTIARSFGDRVFYTCNTAAHIAKNRYSLPAQIPADIANYYQLVSDYFNRGGN